MFGFGQTEVPCPPGYPANYKCFSRFVEKKHANHAYRLLNPVHGPWAFACSANWRVTSKKTAPAGELVEVEFDPRPPLPNVTIENFQPLAGSLSEWINIQKAAGKAVVLDVQGPSYEAFCFTPLNKLPKPSAIRAIATDSAEEAARITQGNPNAFVLFESKRWSGLSAAGVFPIALGVGALAFLAWLLTRPSKDAVPPPESQHREWLDQAKG